MAEQQAVVSPGGKRRMIRSQDSLSEPPRKSPLALGDGLRDSYLGTELGNLTLTAAGPQRWGQYLQNATAGGAAETTDSGICGSDAMDADSEGQVPSCLVPDSVLQAPQQLQARRRSSIDILDDYRSARRRSSGIKAGFKAGEPLQRVSESDERAPGNPLGRPSPSHPSFTSPFTSSSSPLLTRSISTEGLWGGSLRDQRQDTQALLFDSTPDLSIEENYLRFPCLRIQRRGAVCYPDLAHPLLIFPPREMHTPTPL